MQMNTLEGIDRSRETSACTVFLFIRHILQLHCVDCKLKNYSNRTTIPSDKDGKKMEMNAGVEREERRKNSSFCIRVCFRVTYRQCSCSCSGVYIESRPVYI